MLINYLHDGISIMLLLLLTFFQNEPFQKNQKHCQRVKPFGSINGGGTRDL